MTENIEIQKNFNRKYEHIFRSVMPYFGYNMMTKFSID